MSIRLRVCAVLIFTLLQDFRPALAQTSQLQLDLQLVDCPSLDADVVRKLLGIEISAARIDQASIVVAATCDDQQVTAIVTDTVVGELNRSLNWQGVQSNARTRLFSLAVAEMISSARREHDEAARQQLATSSPVLASTAIVVSVQQVPPSAEAEEFAKPTLNAFAGISSLGADWSWAPRLGVGITRPWQGHDNISFLMDLVVTQSASRFRHGDATFTAIGSSPRIQLHSRPTRYQAFVHGGATLEFANVAGSTEEPAIDAQSRNVLLWGPNAGIGIAVNGKRVQVGTSLSATWLPRPIHVRTVSGSSITQENAIARIVPTLNLSIAWQ